jgi:hypothetical protein
MYFFGRKKQDPERMPKYQSYPDEQPQNAIIDHSSNQLAHSVYEDWRNLAISHHSDLIYFSFDDEDYKNILNPACTDEDSAAVFYFYTKMLYDSLHNIKLIFEEQDSLNAEWVNLIIENKIELSRERSNLLKKGKYGQVDDLEWYSEKHTFIDEIIDPSDYITALSNKIQGVESNVHVDMSMSDHKQPEYDDIINRFYDSALAERAGDIYMNEWLPSLDFTDLVRDTVKFRAYTKLALLIDIILDDDSIMPENTSSDDDVSIISPYDYEEMCAKILRQSGWEASATRKSGDQGADVYAERNGISVVLQCKLTDSAVGNKAVQEIISGQKYMSADFAAVVTPAKYTPGAQDLARAAKVLLLHHEDLPHLESLCKRLL